MISRIAEHCFWFGRYLERAESTARVLHVTATLAPDAELPPSACWKPVLMVSGEASHFNALLGEKASESGEHVQKYMSFSEQNQSSILQSVAFARENARAIRDTVSLEVWQMINELYLWLSSNAEGGQGTGIARESAKKTFEENRYQFYRIIRLYTQLVAGFLTSAMLHDTPLDFIMLGAYLERAGQTARTLDMHPYLIGQIPEDKHNPVIETALCLSLLRACSGFEPFMKRNRGRVTTEAVASFLLLDPRFARSIRHCLHQAGEHLDAIRSPQNPLVPGADTEDRLQTMEEWLSSLSPEALGHDGLHAILLRITSDTNSICEAVSREFFGHGLNPSSP